MAKYSDQFRTEAIIKLAVNKFDYTKTAEELGCTERSIRNWEKDFPKNTVPELMERAIERVLMLVPEDMKGKDWAVTFGILMDKWFLLQGMPTSRIESVLNKMQDGGSSEYEDIIKEAEKIIEEANNS